MSDSDEKVNNDSDLEAALEEAKSVAEENMRGWQRAVADFENYKRRDEQLHTQLLALGQEQGIQIFLSLFEDLERLLMHVPESESQLPEWIKGVEGVRKKINDSFKELDIEKIPTVGEKFNPEIHEAVGQIEGEDDGVVSEEISTGYRRGERILRPAQVKVYRKGN